MKELQMTLKEADPLFVIRRLKDKKNNFGKIFNKILTVRKRRFLVNEKREWIYEIPLLEHCRQDFESFVKQSKEIW
jgi:hypothetical protein